MKKTLILIVLTFFLTGIVYAGTFKSNLKPKSGPKQFGYNYYLEEYNKFLNEVDFSKIFDECKSYGISGSGLNGLMAITDCRYRELKYITKKYKLNSDGINRINHDWYLKLRRAFIDYWSATEYANDSKKMKLSEELVIASMSFEKFWFKELELYIDQAATKLNYEMYKNP